MYEYMLLHNLDLEPWLRAFHATHTKTKPQNAFDGATSVKALISCNFAYLTKYIKTYICAYVHIHIHLLI